MLDLSDILHTNFSTESKMLFIIIAQHGENYDKLTLEDLQIQSSMEARKIKKVLKQEEFNIVGDWVKKILKQKSNNDLIFDNDSKNVLLYLNSKAGKNYRFTNSNLKFIKARLKEGVSYDDMLKVIDLKVEHWLGTNMDMYLRPETLFNSTKFETYYQQIQGKIPITNDINDNTNFSDSELEIYCE